MEESNYSFPQESGKKVKFTVEFAIILNFQSKYLGQV